nr:epimerase family protein SDR39U1 homolog, chloroplastic isoform X1 [Tanacetum cinerariifolium]
MELCGGASALSSRTSISPSHFHSFHQPTSVLCEFRRFKVFCVKAADVNGFSQGNQMTVSITGATGFIGTKLVQRLYQDNHSICVLTRTKSKAQSIFPVHSGTWHE